MYTFESRIRYSEVDKSGRLRLESLLDYFQDCSTFHSEDLGLGLDYLREGCLAWVLSAWQIVVGRYPEVGERVAVGTAPYEFRGFLGYRNFLLTAEDGERLAWANSVWTLVNIDTMYPQRPTEKMIEGYVLEERLPMEYAPRKIAVPAEGTKMEQITVKPHHLDTNDHVNNGQYIRMAMDCVPGETRVKQLRAEYKKAAKLGDVLCPVCSAERQGVYTVALNNEAGEACCVVELTLAE